MPLPRVSAEDQTAAARAAHIILPLSDLLVEGSTATRRALKARLIREGVLIAVCVACGQEPFWNGLPLMLQLDHANGVPDDNRLENLRLLCPNCHSQTDTFAGRNRGADRSGVGELVDPPGLEPGDLAGSMPAS